MGTSIWNSSHVHRLYANKWPYPPATISYKNDFTVRNYLKRDWSKVD